jgi:hypothetical protein
VYFRRLEKKVSSLPTLWCIPPCKILLCQPRRSYSIYRHRIRPRRDCMKETPRRRITVTSSLNEISMDQQGNKWGGGCEGGGGLDIQRRRERLFIHLEYLLQGRDLCTSCCELVSLRLPLSHW